MNRKPLLLAVAIGVVILTLVMVYFNSGLGPFRLISTSPPSGSRTNQYTAISFRFNRPLISSGIQLRLSPSAIGKVTVSDSTITFTPDSSYIVNTPYQATASGIQDTTGEKAADATITFTPVYVEYSQLPPEVRQRLVNQTDTSDKGPKPYNPQSIAIGGSNELINHGLSLEQLSALQLAFFQYFQQIKQSVRSMSISNLTKVLHDHSADDYGTLSFDTTLDNKNTYRAKVVLIELTRIQLYLYDSKTGAVVFNSGVIQSSP